MLKKILSVVLTVLLVSAMCVSFASCNKDNKGNKEFKIGVICLHDETSTYDLNFIKAVEEVKTKLNLKDEQVIVKTGIPETNVCLETAEDLVDQGCKIVFADSFGHESFMIDAAKKHPDVMFCHATGTRAHTENLPNYFNAFAAIYEGRYLAGVAAGLKLNELKAAGKLKGDVPKMGYVGAFTYAEVISGFTSFYLGAKSVCPDVVMDVTFTGSWYDVTGEQQAAVKLIETQKCDLISQHADSLGAPGACEDRKVPNVSYNGSTETSCPDTFIVSSRIDWAPYFELIIKAVKDGEGKIPTDYVGTIATGSVKLTDFGAKAPAEGTQAKIDEVMAQLKAGTLKVFDTNTFTVKGEKLSSYMANVDDDAEFKPDTEVIKDGYFHESENRSAPYFDLEIDGITLLDRNYGD